MTNQYRYPNRTDQAVHEFFHSKTWKTILTIWLSMFGAAGLFACCIGVLFMLGLGSSVTAIWIALVQLVSPVPAYINTPPQLTPFAVTAVIQAPNLNPTSTTSSKTWSLVGLDLYSFQMEIPSTWNIQETNRTPDPNSICGLGHDIADYLVTNPMGDEIKVKFLCGPRGGESQICPDATVILDDYRRIVRSKIPGANEYHYGSFSIYSDGSMGCYDGWLIGNVNMIADYQQPDGNFDLPTVDHIVLSVREK